MKIKNTLDKWLDWQPLKHGEGLFVKLDEKDYRLSELQIIPIDENVQESIDRYDAARFQSDEDTVVFYAVWEDGEWQPRATYPDYDTAKKDIDNWFSIYTQELCERRAAQSDD